MIKNRLMTFQEGRCFRNVALFGLSVFYLAALRVLCKNPGGKRKKRSYATQKVKKNKIPSLAEFLSLRFNLNNVTPKFFTPVSQIVKYSSREDGHSANIPGEKKKKRNFALGKRLRAESFPQDERPRG